MKCSHRLAPCSLWPDAAVAGLSGVLKVPEWEANISPKVPGGEQHQFLPPLQLFATVLHTRKNPERAHTQMHLSLCPRSLPKSHLFFVFFCFFLHDFVVRSDPQNYFCLSDLFQNSGSPSALPLLPVGFCKSVSPFIPFAWGSFHGIANALSFLNTKNPLGLFIMY